MGGGKGSFTTMKRWGGISLSHAEGGTEKGFG